MEPSDGIPSPPSDPQPQSELSDWPGFDLGIMPYPIARNDHAASLVPIQHTAAALREAVFVSGNLHLFYGVSDKLVIVSPRFPPVDSKPPGILSFGVNADVDVYLDECDFPAVNEFVMPWMRTGGRYAFHYGSSDPCAVTVFDGHFLTPVAAHYVDNLPGLSSERAFIASIGYVVWTGHYDGRRFVCFQTHKALETDCLYITGCRISHRSPDFWTSIHVPWEEEIPRAWVTADVPPYTQVSSAGGFHPILKHNGKFLAVVPQDEFYVHTPDGIEKHPGCGIRVSGFAKTWTETRILVPLMNGYYAMHGCGGAEIVECVLPHGKVSPTMILNGLIRCGQAPGYNAKVTFKTSYIQDKFGNMIVELQDSFRRFPAPFDIYGDERYALRKLKIHKDPFPPYCYKPRFWRSMSTFSSIPHVMLAGGASDVVHQNLAKWYANVSPVYSVIHWSYAPGNEVLETILLLGRKSGTYYCMALKGRSKRENNWVVAWKYALFFARTIRLMSHDCAVVPAVLDSGVFRCTRRVSDQDLAEYGLGRQIWFDLASYGERSNIPMDITRVFSDKKTQEQL